MMFQKVPKYQKNFWAFFWAKSYKFERNFVIFSQKNRNLQGLGIFEEMQGLPVLIEPLLVVNESLNVSLNDDSQTLKYQLLKK